MSFAPYVPGLPGVRAAKTATQKVVFLGGYIPEILPGGKLVAGDASRDPTNTTTILNLQAGLIMGKISTVVNSLGTVGYYAPSIIDVTAGATAVGATSITISVAGATELQRRCGNSGTFKLTGPSVAGGTTFTETVTYSAIVPSTGVITCTATIGGYVAGSFIQPTDGSEEPLTFIPDGWGIPISDQTGTVLTAIQFPELPIAGTIKSTQLINWPTEVSLQDWLVSRLNGASGGRFVFDSRY